MWKDDINELTDVLKEIKTRFWTSYYFDANRVLNDLE